MINVQQITSEVSDVLSNVQFPAHKSDVVQEAQKAGASEEVQSALQKLPSQQFGSIGEVLSKLEDVPMSEIEGEAGKFL